MLSKNEFFDSVKRNIINFLPDEVRENVEIDETTIVKMNDQKLHGIVIKDKGADAAPNFYLDEMFERYSNGEDMGSLMAELSENYVISRDMPRPMDIDLSWDNVKDSLTLRLLETKRNREFLSTMPHVNVGNGLAMTVDVNMGEDKSGEWRVAVNYDVMKEMGTDKEQLFTEALANAQVYEPAILVDMEEALFMPEQTNLLSRNKPIAQEDLGSLYVLGNPSGSFGASALFYPDVKEKAAEILGSDYYVLPCSVHEVILVPETAGMDERELCSMVKQANRAVVEDKDILSDNVYHYSRDEKKLTMVTAEKQRGDRVAEGR